MTVPATPRPPARESNRLGLTLFMVTLRAVSVSHFVTEARRTKSRQALSAAVFHAAGLRRYADEQLGARLAEKGRADNAD